jgi:hypothetical protein
MTGLPVPGAMSTPFLLGLVGLAELVAIFWLAWPTGLGFATLDRLDGFLGLKNGGV